MSGSAVDVIWLSAQMIRTAALGDAAGLQGLIGAAGSSAPGVAAVVARQQLGPLLHGALRGVACDPQTVAFLDRLPTEGRVPQRELLAAYAALREVLEIGGVPAILLKGAVLGAELYGGIDARGQHDIDVLVRRRQARAAHRMLQREGYRRRRRDGHSVTFARGAINVDLHHALRTAPAYRIDEAPMWERVRMVLIEETTVRALADEDTLALLTTSLMEDSAFGMAKLKVLCDIWLLIRRLDPTLDWEEWFEKRRAENLEGLAVNGCTLALQIMGSAEDGWKIYHALRARSHLVRIESPARALALMSGPRGSAQSMAWFGTVYPGSLPAFRLHALVMGLPATLRDVRPGFQLHLLRAQRAGRGED